MGRWRGTSACPRQRKVVDLTTLPKTEPKKPGTEQKNLAQNKKNLAILLRAGTWGVEVASPSSHDMRSWYTTSLVSVAVKKSMPASQPEALAASKASAATGIMASDTAAFVASSHPSHSTTHVTVSFISPRISGSRVDKSYSGFGVHGKHSPAPTHIPQDQDASQTFDSAISTRSQHISRTLVQLTLRAPPKPLGRPHTLQHSLVCVPRTD